MNSKTGLKLVLTPNGSPDHAVQLVLTPTKRQTKPAPLPESCALKVNLVLGKQEITGTVDVPVGEFAPAGLEALAEVIKTFAEQNGVPPVEVLQDIRGVWVLNRGEPPKFVNPRALPKPKVATDLPKITRKKKV